MRKISAKVTDAVKDSFEGYICLMNIKDDIQSRWWFLEEKLLTRFGKKPDMEAILFLIGIQELGELQPKFTKEQKQDLMHVAICTLLSPSGYYELETVDEEGWPHYRQLKPLPVLNMIEQENFMKDHILMYFENQDANM
jgi:hypothetical protein